VVIFCHNFTCLFGYKLIIELVSVKLEGFFFSNGYGEIDKIVCFLILGIED
jgi:hypothetical protein